MGQPVPTDLPTTTAQLDAGPVEYRWDRRAGAVVIVFHGGHMRAGLALGEEVFADAGYSVLAPSRPGYGRTPLSVGGSVAGFADTTRVLCDHLGISRVEAVVGISGGGPTAVAMAARHPGQVRRLILQSAVGPPSWPDRGTRLGAHLGFHATTEGATWGAVRALLRLAPDTGLQLMLGGLSTMPGRDVLAGLGPDDRDTLRGLFSTMRSGQGFLNDLHPAPDVTAAVTQPTLVIATRHDGGVPFAHALALAAAIPNAELVESRADSHLIWFGPDWRAIARRIRVFLGGVSPERAAGDAAG